MSDLARFCSGALIAAVILIVVYLLFGRKAMQACSIRMALVGVVAVLALLALIAVLNRIQ